jgi:hypothetical protein
LLSRTAGIRPSPSPSCQLQLQASLGVRIRRILSAETVELSELPAIAFKTLDRPLCPSLNLGLTKSLPRILRNSRTVGFCLAEGLQARSNDIYGITIEAGQDGALMVAMALCIDEIVRMGECVVKSNFRGAPPSDSPLNTVTSLWIHTRSDNFPFIMFLRPGLYFLRYITTM